MFLKIYFFSLENNETSNEYLQISKKQKYKYKQVKSIYNHTKYNLLWIVWLGVDTILNNVKEN